MHILKCNCSSASRADARDKAMQIFKCKRSSASRADARDKAMHIFKFKCSSASCHRDTTHPRGGLKVFISVVRIFFPSIEHLLAASSRGICSSPSSKHAYKELHQTKHTSNFQHPQHKVVHIIRNDIRRYCSQGSHQDVLDCFRPRQLHNARQIESQRRARRQFSHREEKKIKKKS